MKKYKLTGISTEIVMPAENQTITDSGNNKYWRAYQAWLAEGNTPDPEFTAAELKAKAKAEKEADARAALKERVWQESPEKAALK